jgi:PhoPQ-activated pathogenicity-related protein
MQVKARIKRQIAKKELPQGGIKGQPEGFVVTGITRKPWVA